MPLNMKISNNFTREKWISPCDDHARDHTPRVPREVWVQYAERSEHFQYTFRAFTKEPIGEQKVCELKSYLEC